MPHVSAPSSSSSSGTSPPPLLTASPPTQAAPPTLPSGFLKGQLHAHSSRSGDSETPPADVRRWYAAHRYDFVVLTDHNVVGALPTDDGTLVLPGVELTMNPPFCDPPVRASACALHLNALFVDPRSEGRVELDGAAHAEKPIRRRDAYVAETARALALGGLPMLCHPNFAFSGPTVEDLLHLEKRGLRLVEIHNESWDSQNEGDDAHPSTEALWDGALARGARLYGTATDDAHHYADAADLRARGELPFDGDRGFVVVRAERNAQSIRAAIASGDFYASTGLLLTGIERRKDGITLTTAEPADFEVIGRSGTRRERGTTLDARLRSADGPYLRVRITQGTLRAWTQPVFR